MKFDFENRKFKKTVLFQQMIFICQLLYSNFSYKLFSHVKVFKICELKKIKLQIKKKTKQNILCRIFD